MRKHAALIVSLFAGAGIAGAALRYIHITTCYDSGGLPIEGMLVTNILLVIALLFAAAALIISIICGAKSTADSGNVGAFSVKNGGAGLIVQCIGAILIVASSLLSFLEADSNYSALLILTSVLGVLTAAVIIYTAVCNYKNSQKRAIGYLAIIPAVYFGLHLAVLFSQNVANPVLLTYAFDCVAFAAATLHVFSAGGYALDKSQNITTLFSGLMSITFSLTAITGQQTSTADALLFLSIALIAFPNTVVFIKNLHPKK